MDFRVMSQAELGFLAGRPSGDSGKKGLEKDSVSYPLSETFGKFK